MGRVQLVADGGEMTIGRAYVRFVYGAWDVKLPDGDQQGQRDERINDGYFHVPEQPRRGRSDFACVRADATVDATDGLLKGRSNVEENLKKAYSRAGGDVFFERDITNAGLGLYVPGLDFNEGDVVDVRLWGKRIGMPVSSIEMTTSRAHHLGWKVHVGGGLIADHDALDQKNRSIMSALATERRKNQKNASKVSRESSHAVSTATRAKEDSARSLTKVEQAIKTAKDADLNSVEGRKVAIAANTQALEALEISNNAQSEAIRAVQATAENAQALARMNRMLIEQNTKLINLVHQNATQTLFCDRGQNETDQYLTLDNTQGAVTRWIAKGDWEGEVAVFITYAAHPTIVRWYPVSRGLPRSWEFNDKLGITRSVQNALAMYKVRKDNGEA